MNVKDISSEGEQILFKAQQHRVLPGGTTSYEMVGSIEMTRILSGKSPSFFIFELSPT